MASPTNPIDTTERVKTSGPHYTVFIRLPFGRGDYVDPPPVSTINSLTLPWTHYCTGEVGLDQGSCSVGCNLRSIKWPGGRLCVTQERCPIFADDTRARAVRLSEFKFQ